MRKIEETIDLMELFSMIRKKVWMILLITVMAVMITAAGTFFLLTPIYETSTTLIVSRAQDTTDPNLQYQDILISQRLVNTYREIVTSNRVLYTVIDAGEIDFTADEIREMVEVTSLRNTEIISISVRNSDSQFATDLANAIAAIFMEEVIEIMRIENVQVIDIARLPDTPVSPQPLLNIAIGAVLGFMLGLGLVFLLHYLDNTIKTPEALEKRLGLTVIGVIPDFES